MRLGLAASKYKDRHAEVRARLTTLIQEVPAGKFIQIERWGISETAPVSVVALRFTGDREEFSKKITAMFDDACEAQLDHERLAVQVTD